MANFDDLKLAVESLSGGTNTIILDDVGMPSVMVAVAKLLNSDLVSGGLATAHPAFIMNNVELAKVYESKYQNIIVNNRAYSLPMQDPKASITFDASLAACRQKGEGWGVQPFSLWSAIALWCKKNGTMPRGNNNYGSDHSAPWERAVPSMALDVQGRAQRCATGSGPATWYHDHTKHGIADLNGNVYEWCAGFRLKGGELQVIPYANCMLSSCDMSLNSGEWKALNANGEYVTPGTSGTIKLDYVSSHWRWIAADSWTSKEDSSRGCGFQSIDTDGNITDDGKKVLRALALLPESGDTGYGSDYFYANNGADERFPSRGGSWHNTSSAGVVSTNLSNPRSYSDRGVAFRSAFYGTL